MSEKAALLLLPNLLGDQRHHQSYLPAAVDKAIETIDGLIAESETEGRRYLKRFFTPQRAAEIPIALFNEHTPDGDVDFVLEPIAKGERWGLVSDAGLPCIADPGAKLVRRARQRGMVVQAFVGPSAILLGLMLSGLAGQKFTFHGYIAREAGERKRQLQKWSQESRKEETTQIFMEAPYRNRQTLEEAILTLPDSAWFCVAWDLTLPTQGVISQPIEQWKKMTLPSIDKKPAIFLFSNI